MTTNQEQTTLDAEQWDAFNQLLAAPLPATPKLDALIAAPSPFTA